MKSITTPTKIGEFTSQESAEIGKEVLALFFPNIPTEITQPRANRWHIMARSGENKQAQLTASLVKRMKAVLDNPEQRHEVRIYVSVDQLFDMPDGATAQARIYAALGITPPQKGGPRENSGAYWMNDTAAAKQARANWYKARWSPERLKKGKTTVNQ